MPTTVTKTKDGYIGFTTHATRGGDYQSAGHSLVYEFAKPTDAAGLVERVNEAENLVREMAAASLEAVLAEKEARIEGAKEKQTRSKSASKQHSKAKAADEIEWQWAKPANGRGKSFKFVGTDDISIDELKGMVEAEIEAKGSDPELYKVWDNRPKLEETGKGYRVVDITPNDEHPAYEFMLKDNGYPRVAFYLDFNEDGTIRLKATPDLVKASQKAKDAEESEDDGDEELPF